jgi:transcriptional regulator with XRE-family HTH domain
MENCNFLQYNYGMNRQPRFRADRLKEEVEKLSIKPGKLAEDLGISYETLYKTLRGEIAQPPAETIAKIAVKTKRSIEYYMDMTDSKTPPTLELTDMQLRIVEMLQTLPSVRQHDVMLITQTYLENNEESTRRFFTEVKEMIKAAADVMGKSEVIAQYMEIVNAAERQQLTLPGPANDNEDGNTDRREQNP